MKSVWWIWLVCSSLAFSGTIYIAVAANVSYAIEALKHEFNSSYPDTKVNVTLGGSGKLTAQIMHGAPYTLFLSADMKYPNALYQKKFASTKPIVYAQGTLVMLSTQKRDYSAKMDLLKSPDIKKIALANPQTAPYGTAAVESLKNAKLYDALKDKFVYGESISQTVIYTTTAADIGFIAKSALYAPQMTAYKEANHWSEVDSSLYTPIDQGMVILYRAKDNTEVKAFYDFMQSSKAQMILKQFGYKVQ